MRGFTGIADLRADKPGERVSAADLARWGDEDAEAIWEAVRAVIVRGLLEGGSDDQAQTA